MENRDTRIENLRALVAEFGSIVAVAKQCETAEAYLSQLLNGVSLPSGAARSIGHKLARKVEVAESLAAAFGVTGWQLIHPGLHKNLVSDKKFEKIITDYIEASTEGREIIFRIAEREAQYGDKNK